MAEEKTLISTSVSPALHEASTEPWAAPLTVDGKPLPALTAARSAMRALYSGLSDCETAVTSYKVQYGISTPTRGQPMPPQLTEERSNELAASLGVKFSQVAKTVDANVAALNDAISTLDQQIAASLVQPRKDALTAAAESDVRNYVRSMPTQSDRLNWLHARVADGSHAEIAAVVASPWASGLDKSGQETLLDLARQRWAPIQSAQLSACKSLHSHCIAGSQRFVNRFKSIAPVPTVDSPAVAAAKKLRE